MSQNKEVKSKGAVVYDDSIVQNIVEIAVKSVEGVVLPVLKKGKTTKDYIKVVSDKSGINVSVSVAIKYGYTVPDVAYNIQHGIRQNVELMTRYKISKIDVLINDVVFEEKQPQAEA